MDELVENVQDQFPFPSASPALSSDLSVDSTTSIKSDDSLLADQLGTASKSDFKMPPNAPMIRPSNPEMVLLNSAPVRSRLHDKLNPLLLEMARSDFTIIGHSEDKLFPDTEVLHARMMSDLRNIIGPPNFCDDDAPSTSSFKAANSDGEPVVALVALILFSNHFCARLLNSYIGPMCLFAEFDEEWSTRLRAFAGQDPVHLWMEENNIRSAEPSFFKVHNAIKRYMPFVMKLLQPYLELCLKNPATQKWAPKLATLMAEFHNNSIIKERDFQSFLHMCVEYFGDFVGVSPSVYLRNAVIYSAAKLYQSNNLSSEDLTSLSRAPDFSISFCSLLTLLVVKDVGHSPDFVFVNLQQMGESMKMALMKALLLIHDSRNSNYVDEDLSTLTWNMLTITLQHIVTDKYAMRTVSVCCDESFLIKIAASPLATLTCLKAVLGDDVRLQKPFYGNMFEWRFLLRIPCAFTLAYLLALSDTLTILKVIEELLLDAMISFCANMPNTYELAVCTALGFLKDLDEEWVYRSMIEYYGAEFCRSHALNSFKLRNTWLMILNNSNGLYWIQQCLLKMKTAEDQFENSSRSVFSADHLLQSEPELKQFGGRNPVAALVTRVDRSLPDDYPGFKEEWHNLIKKIPVPTWISVISSGLNTARSPKSLEAFVFPWLIELTNSQFRDMPSLEMAIAMEAVVGAAIQYQLVSTGEISSVLPVIQLLTKIAGEKCEHKELLPIISSSLFDHMKTVRSSPACTSDQGYSYLLYYIMCLCMIKYCKAPTRKPSLNPMANSVIGHSIFTMLTMAFQSKGDFAAYEFVNWMFKRPSHTFGESPARHVKYIFACLPTNVCMRFIFGYIETFIKNPQLLDMPAKEVYWIPAHYFCDYALFGHARNKGDRIRYNEGIFVSSYQIRLVEILFKHSSYEQIVKMLEAIREYTETRPVKGIGFTPIKEFEVPIFASFEESHVFRCRWFFRGFFKEIIKNYRYHEQLSNDLFMFVINKENGWWEYLCWKDTIVMEFVASAFAADALNEHNEWLLLQLLGNMAPPKQESFMIELKSKGFTFVDILKKKLWGRRL